MPTSTWGPHVWTFIHTFAYHIDESFFTNNKKDVIHLLFNICFNLPCMECTMHAKAYLVRANKSKIQTKEDLKRFFYDFHNIVNKRLKRQVFTDYDIYKSYSLQKSFINFKLAYTNNTFLRNQLHVTFARRRVCNNIETFIKRNQKQFTLL